MPLSLEPLLPHLPVWTLVLFRLSGLFLMAPMLGSRMIPPKIKIMLALGLSFCIYPLLLAPGRPSAAMLMPVLESGLGLWSVVGAVMSELMIGLLLGLGASLPLIGMQVAGQVIDQQLGLGIAGVLNPETDEQTGITGEFLFFMSLAIFLVLGGHRILVLTLLKTFETIPLGGFRADGRLVELLVALMSGMFELAMRVSAPLLCLVFLESVALGFIARTVPQLNVLSVGFAVRILIGAAVVIAGLALKANVFIETMRGALGHLGSFFGL